MLIRILFASKGDLQRAFKFFHTNAPARRLLQSDEFLLANSFAYHFFEPLVEDGRSAHVTWLRVNKSEPEPRSMILLQNREEEEEVDSPDGEVRALR